MKKAKNLLFLIGIISLCFFACGKKVDIPPAKILSQDKMVIILADIHFAEATIQIQNLGYNDSTKAIAYSYYKFIFNKNNTNANEFTQSFSWYKDRPEILKLIYDKVLTRISENQAMSIKK